MKTWHKIGILFLCAGLFSIVNAFAQQTAAQNAKQEFQKIDANKDGYITSDEMQAYEAKKFGDLDKDKNGVLDVNELRADKTGMFAGSDADKDGKVTEQEARARFRDYFQKMDKDKEKRVSQAGYEDYWKLLPNF